MVNGDKIRFPNIKYTLQRVHTGRDHSTGEWWNAISKTANGHSYDQHSFLEAGGAVEIPAPRPIMRPALPETQTRLGSGLFDTEQGLYIADLSPN